MEAVKNFPFFLLIHSESPLWELEEREHSNKTQRNHLPFKTLVIPFIKTDFLIIILFPPNTHRNSRHSYFNPRSGLHFSDPSWKQVFIFTNLPYVIVLNVLLLSNFFSKPSKNSLDEQKKHPVHPPVPGKIDGRQKGLLVKNLRISPRHFDFFYILFFKILLSSGFFCCGWYVASLKMDPS